ncbi:hypothetical protein FXB40_28930 [Bradyrhizobium rifense]|uniref:Uncharacterized protein n=1 Tax=Bradyrhizobium rifense TaxID=515499 RepID=A0A5D3K6A8_9BRAD|nr:hypothetical protein [Bradyrhizobium rifense]TYL91328.1 hypothetical protein FXB40_28930 [Bradyrhizobium rifense]
MDGLFIAGSLLRHLIKTFDQSASVPERVRRLEGGSARTGEDFLRRIKGAETGIRIARAEGNQEKLREETDDLNHSLDGAMQAFAEAAGILSRADRCSALYYYAVCAAKAGRYAAAARELSEIKPKLIEIREEAIKKGAPGKPGIGSFIFAALVGGVMLLLTNVFFAAIVAAIIWLLTAWVVTSVDQRIANELVDVCELGRLVAPDDAAAAWAVPPWALRNVSTQEQRVGVASG